MHVGGINMLVEEINELREELNKQVENCSLVNEAILTLSQNLDDLIIEYYRFTINAK
jgi:hypothetical protein